MCNGNCNKCGVVTEKHPHDEEIAKLERLWQRLADKEKVLEEQLENLIDKRQAVEEEIYDLENKNY